MIETERTPSFFKLDREMYFCIFLYSFSITRQYEKYLLDFIYIYI